MARSEGTVVRERITSKALLGNPLGDPVERDLLVYLPPGYEKEAARRYPLVLVLMGVGFSLLGDGLADRSGRRLELPS